MKTVWINKVRKREVKSGYKILSLEIPSDPTGKFADDVCGGYGNFAFFFGGNSFP